MNNLLSIEANYLKKGNSLKHPFAIRHFGKTHKATLQANFAK